AAAADALARAAEPQAVRPLEVMVILAALAAVVVIAIGRPLVEQMTALWRIRFSFAAVVAVLGIFLSFLGVKPVGVGLLPDWLTGRSVSGDIHQPNDFVVHTLLILQAFLAGMLMSVLIFRRCSGLPVRPAEQLPNANDSHRPVA